MIRTLSLELDQPSWTNRQRAVPPVLLRMRGNQAVPPQVQVNVLEALLFLAIVTRPPSLLGFTLSDMWAWFRYVPALDDGPGLRLEPRWRDVDSHQKTILSDDFGMGFSLAVLTPALGWGLAAPTLNVLRSIDPNVLQLLQAARRGPAKSPDFVILDPNGTDFSVLECKGTQSSVSYLESAVADGIAQKDNAGPGPNGRLKEALVAGLFVPQSDNAEPARLLVSDPSFSEVVSSLLRSSPERVARAVVQTGLAQQLSLAGLPAAADRIVGASVDSSAPSVADALGARTEERERAVQEVALRQHYQFPVDVHNDGRVFRSITFEAQVPDQIRTIALEERDVVPFIEEASLVGRTDGASWSVSSGSDSASVTTPLGFQFRLSLDE